VGSRAIALALPLRHYSKPTMTSKAFIATDMRDLAITAFKR
jgi:hypothetical protein